MVRSMTGFGVGRASDGGLGIAVEIRSVNNRFLDLSLKLPRILYPFEADVRELVNSRIQRGRVSLFVTEEWAEEVSPNIRVNRGAVRKYVELLNSLCTEYQLQDEVKLAHLLTLSDIFSSGDDDSVREREWMLAQKAINLALDQMVEISTLEGERLATDLRQRITTMQADLAIVEEWAGKQVQQYANRLRQRLSELMEDSRLDQSRLETEITIIADRLDISEEITRLKSHIVMFNKTLSGNNAGKTLGFVLQEMGREVNTISSKSWVVHISQTAVRMKETLEQIREQVQNIE